MATCCSDDYVVSRCVVREYEDTETLPLPGESEDKGSKTRYQKYYSRPQHCDLDVKGFELVSLGKYATKWKGISLMKECFTLIAYEQLLWELKPRTLIEFGTWKGGSALWLNDIMSAYGTDFHVYTMDIDTDKCSEIAKEAKHVTFLKGDCYKPEETFTADMLKNLPHPWFVMDDAHENGYNIWKYLNNFMHRGDYYILEDTNLLAQSFYPPEFLTDVPEKDEDGNTIVMGVVDFEKTKPEMNILAKAAAAMEEIMKTYHTQYRVDAKYTDLFGTNVSCNKNSFYVKL